MKTHEFTGKTTQEAIDQGLSELGKTIADVRVEVIQEGAKGLFGLFGSKPAKVRIIVLEEEKEEDEGLSDLLGSFSLDSNTKKAKPKTQQTKPATEEKKVENKSEQPVVEESTESSSKEPKVKEEPKVSEVITVEPVQPVKEKSEESASETAGVKVKVETKKNKQTGEKKPVKKAAEPAELKEEPEIVSEAEEESQPVPPFLPTESAVILPEDTPGGKAQRFLIEMTKRMNVTVEVYVDDTQPDTINIHMIGDTLGILIGRRGETLDALQYLTSLQVNKGQEDYIRVTVDSENYRAKREDSLKRLALRMANRAQKTGRRVVLEPMNPYERRVLHTTLQNHPAVTTHSEGEEPNRHVVIMLKNSQSNRQIEVKEKNGQEGQNSRKKGRRRYPKKVNRARGESEAMEDEGLAVVEIVEENTED